LLIVVSLAQRKKRSPIYEIAKKSLWARAVLRLGQGSFAERSSDKFFVATKVKELLNFSHTNSIFSKEEALGKESPKNYICAFVSSQRKLTFIRLSEIFKDPIILLYYFGINLNILIFSVRVLKLFIYLIFNFPVNHKK
jgi:hypothetical protein